MDGVNCVGIVGCRRHAFVDSLVPSPIGRPVGELEPAGNKPLANWEVFLSTQHGPTDEAGKPLCWDNPCWIGCSRGAQECAHSHELVKGTRDLHWTVLAQVLRRGGLKSGPKVEPSSVDGRVTQLRSQAKAEKEKAKAAGGPKAGAAGAGGGARGGWAPQTEYEELQLTDIEDPLREALLGPDPR